MMARTPGKLLPIILIAAALTAITLMLCLAIGPGAPGQRAISFGIPHPDILRLRLTRVGSAAIAGAALGLAGVLLQGLLRNALADPFILGISSGSTVGVMIWIVFGQALLHAFAGQPWLQDILANGQSIPALAGAAVATWLVFLLGRRRSGILDPMTLLLSGVVISAIGGALIMLLNNLVPYGARADILSYMFGYISEGTSHTLLTVAALTLGLAWAGALRLGGAMNVAALSDAEAQSLGVKLGSLRFLSFALAALATASSITVAGPIGFVGLICPHVCRGIFGPDHRQLLITSPLLGAIFLMLSDTFVRSTGVWFNGELPVGVITALCGGPFFLYLLTRRRTWM
jgi:iron complex transport system permease protein